MNHVIVAGIKPSKKTVSVTGLSSLEDIIQEKFETLTKQDLLTKCKFIMGKGDENIIQFLAKQDVVSLRKIFLNSLTFQIELQQRAENSQPFNASLAMMSKHRLDVNTGNGVKREWLTVTYGNICEMNLQAGDDFTKYAVEEGFDFEGLGNTKSYFVFIQRLLGYEPKIVDDKIISAPKTKGKGGAIITKDNKPLFYKSNLVFIPVKDDEEFNKFYQDYQKQEIENTKAFEGDGEITDYPPMNKTEDGFSEEFQQFIHVLFQTQHNEMLSKVTA